MESMIRQFYEIPGKVLTLKPGEYLFHEGDHAKNFFFVRTGKIFITKFAESGRVLSLRLATKGSIIGFTFSTPLLKVRPKSTRLNSRRSTATLKKNRGLQLIC